MQLAESEDGGGLTVDLAYSLDGGATWTDLATDAANTGAFDWTLPETLTDSALVAVTGRDTEGGSASDTSAAFFRIEPSFPAGTLALDLGEAETPSGTRVTLPLEADLDGSPVAVRFEVADRHPVGWLV